MSVKFPSKRSLGPYSYFKSVDVFLHVCHELDHKPCQYTFELKKSLLPYISYISMKEMRNKGIDIRDSWISRYSLMLKMYEDGL